MAARMCNVPQTDRQDNIKTKAMLIMNNVHREPSWVELWPCLFYARTRLPSLSPFPLLSQLNGKLLNQYAKQQAACGKEAGGEIPLATATAG